MANALITGFQRIVHRAPPAPTCFRCFGSGYEVRTHDWNGGGVVSDVAADPGPMGDQLVRMKTGAMVRAVGRIPSPRQATGRVLAVTMAGEIDLVTVDKVRTALAAGLDQLEDGEVLVIDLTGVTFVEFDGGCRPSSTQSRLPSGGACSCGSSSIALGR